MPLQSSDNTRLSIKKKKNNRNKRSTILKKSALYSGNKRNPKKKKKKKKGSKNPKTQNVLPDQDSYSLSLQTLLCSFKHTDRP